MASTPIHRQWVGSRDEMVTFNIFSLNLMEKKTTTKGASQARCDYANFNGMLCL
jgi:hypothetical protein